MSNSNQVTLGAIAEVVPGVTPVGALQEIDFTTEGFVQNTTSIESKTIRSDRQIPDIIRTDTQPGGPFAFNFKYGNVDQFFAGSLMNSWAADLALTGAAVIAAAGQTITSNSTTGGPDFTNVQIGQWIKLGGATNPANNGFFKVTAKNVAVPTAMVLTVAQGTLPLVNESVAVMTIKGSTLTNGTTFSSFSFEKQYNDTVKFDSFKGMTPGGMTLAIKTGAQIDGTFTFNGLYAALSQTVTIGNGTLTAPPTTQELNTIDHVKWIREGGVLLTADLMDFSFDEQNTLRSRKAVSHLAPVSIGLGVTKITGKFGVYFADRALLDKARNHTETSLSMLLQDDAGNGYIFEWPSIFLTGGDPVVPGTDTDVTAAFDWQARLGGLSNKMMIVTRFSA